MVFSVKGIELTQSLFMFIITTYYLDNEKN